MNIIARRKTYFAISICAILIGLGFMFYNISTGKGAFNYDVEFTGGTEMVVDMGREFDNNEIETLVKETLDGQSPQIQKILGTNQVSIKFQTTNSEERTKLTTAFKDKYGLEDGVITISDINASIGDEMKQTAVLAVVAACVGILLYVTFRFRDFNTGAAAVCALVHDSVLVILSYAVFRIPLNYSFIAVVLTILGFSINATIVIFDRVRENKRLMARSALDNLLNVSVTQTFKRCVYTSVTVLILTICLYVNGVPAIRDFTLPMMVGVLWGTYSSIYLSSSFFYVFSTKKADRV